MSYTINISGHKDTESTEESLAFEEEIVAKAKEFVASIDGVTSATASTGQLGTTQLKESS